MDLLFEGAARIVTGSCFLLSARAKKILIDCGMRQGSDAKTDDGVFSFTPESIDAVLITHAHIDHSGLLPMLFKQGFRGDVYATKVTKELCLIMLADSGHIQEMEAEWKTRKAIRAGRAAVLPIYTAEDGLLAAQHIQAFDYGVEFPVFEGIKARFTDAGHLLGSAMIKLWIDEDGKQKQLVFSGDIGNHDRPILRDPHEFETADVVVMESTYGDRLHPPRADAVKLLAGIIKTTFDKGGNVVIPAFSVGRTQELLYDLSAIMRAGMEGLGSFDVYVDSPLSSKATKVFAANFNRGYFDDEAIALKNRGIDPFAFDTLHFVETADESKALNVIATSKVIISASGMCEAGRIKHHLKHNLFRRECAVVFAGYQAEGTLGRSIVEGAKRVRIFGEEIEVKASVHRLEGFSGHADQAGLLEWIGAFDNRPKVMVTHGEDAVAAGFAQLLIDRGYDAHAPREGDAFDLLTGELREAPPTRALPEAKAAVAEQPVEMVGERLGWGGIKARLRQDGERMMLTASLLERFLGSQSRKKRKQYGSLIRIVRNAAKEMIRG